MVKRDLSQDTRILQHMQINPINKLKDKNYMIISKDAEKALGQEDPLEKETAIHSSILAWETPWIEVPGGMVTYGHKESDAT